MTINILTIEDLERFKKELLEEIKILIANSTPTKKQWLKSPDVREMLGISPGTLQTLRINRTLAYTKIGGTIYYEYADVVNALEKNKRNRS
jgi:Helix-turn-helix domain